MAADPDATPEERLRTWLAEQEAAGALDRPRREPRVALNAALLIVGLAIWGLFGWALARRMFG